MGQTAYSNGQTAITMAQIILWAQRQNPQLAIGSPDFYGAAELVLPVYAKAYQGDYYNTPSQTSAPTALPTAQSTLTAGNFYEVGFPSDAVDVGIQSMELLWDTSNLKLITQPLILNVQTEDTWDVSTGNTTTVYWRMDGRKVRMWIPTAYVTVNPKYAFGYERFPTYPTIGTDILDVPAEDFQTFYNLWFAAIIADSLSSGSATAGMACFVTPTGTIDGTNVTFTLPSNVAGDIFGNPAIVAGWLNSAGLLITLDFTITVGTSTITMTSAPPIGSDLRFTYISL